MKAAVGWSLALLAVVASYLRWGWQGVMLAVTMIVFWLLLQFGQALRAMRDAAARPLGTTDNALMLHARLRRGMRLLQILPLAGSLGQKVADEPETFVWTDGGGDRVRVELRGGRAVSVALERTAPPPAGSLTESPGASSGASSAPP